MRLRLANEKGINTFQQVYINWSTLSLGKVHLNHIITNIKNSAFTMSDNPIEEDDYNHPCAKFSLGYIKHLYMTKEIAALQLMTLSNLYFYKQLIESIKKSTSGIVESLMNDSLGDFFEKNPSQAKKIINKSVDAAKAREAAKKARDLTRRKSEAMVQLKDLLLLYQ